MYYRQYKSYVYGYLTYSNNHPSSGNKASRSEDGAERREGLVASEKQWHVRRSISADVAERVMGAPGGIASLSLAGIPPAGMPSCRSRSGWRQRQLSHSIMPMPLPSSHCTHSGLGLGQPIRTLRLRLVARGAFALEVAGAAGPALRGTAGGVRDALGLSLSGCSQ
ncbi:hypothetical protein GALMADRAFT_707416 [Galerina marginata CBS 339.88]|uniref:Uncharacterized protein n=1 Tax=Galerina marginata (strain CBS 339.88) TaxID=685588 RepID=A0A067TPR2_GALM3|nr:hypothetical protein GALMADRAFT_707416 [Galerina marginata CBS 339.88]